MFMYMYSRSSQIFNLDLTLISTHFICNDFEKGTLQNIVLHRRLKTVSLRVHLAIQYIENLALFKLHLGLTGLTCAYNLCKLFECKGGRSWDSDK